MQVNEQDTLDFLPRLLRSSMSRIERSRSTSKKDDLTLKVDAKLIDDTFKGLKLVAARSVDAPRVRRHEEAYDEDRKL